MPENVFVVLDHGERGQRATVRGVFADEDNAQKRKREISGLFKWVTVEPSSFE